MKILIIGGIASSLINFRGDLIKDIIKDGHVVHTASGETSKKLAEKLYSMGVIHHPLHLKRTNISIIENFRLFIEILFLCIEYKPDIVLCYTIKPSTIGVLAAHFAKIKNIKVMITGLGYTFEHENTKKFIIFNLVKILYRISLRYCNLVIFQNAKDREIFLKTKILTKKAKICLINGSGVDIEKFKPMNFPKVVGFLMIGRLLKTKGVEEYIDASRIIKKKYPKINIYLLGDIDSNPESISKEKTKEWIEEGIVSFSNWVEDVRPFLEKCSVYVLPSYREGLPRTVLEAMACGRPIITTNTAGCEETIILEKDSKIIGINHAKKGKNGILIPVKSVKSLRDAMEYFIINSKEIPLMGRYSRESAVEKFDVKIINEKMKEYLGL